MGYRSILTSIAHAIKARKPAHRIVFFERSGCGRERRMPAFLAAESGEMELRFLRQSKDALTHRGEMR